MFRLCSSLLLSVLVFCACNNKKTGGDLPVQAVEENVFAIFEDTASRIEIKPSSLLLPFKAKLIITRRLKPDTLFQLTDALRSFAKGKDYLTYIPFPPIGDWRIIAIPVKSDTVVHNYTLLSIGKTDVADSLHIQGEMRRRNRSITTFFDVERDYAINVTTIYENGGNNYYLYQRFMVNDSTGRFDPMPLPELNAASCFSTQTYNYFPICSDDVSYLPFREIRCNHIENLKDYTCFEGMRYLTLYLSDSKLCYLLVFADCGDSSYTDFVITRNDRIVSSLTLDSADYTEDENGLVSGQETTFEIDADFNIRLKHTDLKKDSVIGERFENYRIDSEGKFYKTRF
jgi:hypothetical protein